MREMAEDYPGATQEEWEVVVKQVQQKIEGSDHIPDELKTLIAEGVRTHPQFLEVEYKNGTGQKFQTGQIGWKFWAIRKDSLRLVEVLAGTAMAITTFVAVVGASPAVMAVSLIFAGVALADRLKNKSASLDDEQYRIILCLKGLGPTTLSDLAAKLSGLHIYGENVWTEERTLEALKKLQSVHLGDGSTEALVTQAATGLWAVNGV
jgi:hypothetical protein